MVLPPHSVAIQAVLHWQYLSISRGGRSLLERLLAVFPEDTVSQYIGFYALRKHAELNGEPVTEQVRPCTARGKVIRRLMGALGTHRFTSTAS